MVIKIARSWWRICHLLNYDYQLMSVGSHSVKTLKIYLLFWDNPCYLKTHHINVDPAWLSRNLQLVVCVWCKASDATIWAQEFWVFFGIFGFKLFWTKNSPHWCESSKVMSRNLQLVVCVRGEATNTTPWSQVFFWFLSFVLKYQTWINTIKK